MGTIGNHVKIKEIKEIKQFEEIEEIKWKLSRDQALIKHETGRT
ncbi:hypothetical protein [Paenibacillus senegalensis]|nr:hypothetical protein [Paenibacillus senegalensis]